MITDRTPIDRLLSSVGDGFRRWCTKRIVHPRVEQKVSHPVLIALAAAGRPLTNKQLAAAMGVSPSYASRLRQQVAEHVRTYRVGRCVYVALPHWTVN